MSEAILRMEEVHKSFHQGGKMLHILNGASLEVQPQEKLAMVGPSGCGKSSLIQIAGLLDGYDQGQVMLQGAPTTALSERQRTHTRRDHLGFIYQHHHLLPECSALENVMLPQLLQSTSKKDASAHAMHLLDRLEMADRASHRPAALSGGQMQRVAIARALANRPALVLADEPTGNLDPDTAARVMQVMLDLMGEQGASLLMVTHDANLAAQMDRRLTLKEGKVVAI